MRPNAGLIEALRVPLALNLQALRALLAQNQLRLSAMADTEARHDLASAAARLGWRRPQRPAASLVLLLGLVAAGGLVVIALLASGTGEVAMLGLLVLLAVAAPVDRRAIRCSHPASSGASRVGRGIAGRISPVRCTSSRTTVSPRA